MKTTLLLIVLTATPGFSADQYQDTVAIKSLIERATSLEQKYPDSALLLYKQVAEASQAIHYVRGAAKAYHYSGIVSSDQGNYGEAILNYQKAITLYKELNDTRGESGCYINLGNVYYFQGILQESVNYYLKGLMLVEANRDSAKMPTLYTNLGSVYSDTKQYEKSISLHKKGLRVAEAKGDTLSIIASNSNTGVVLLNYESVDSAKWYFERSLHLAELIDDPQRRYESLVNLGEVEKSKGDFARALHYSELALVQAKRTGKPYDISSATLTVGFHYININNLPLALVYLKEGLKVSTEHKILSNMARGSDWLSRAEEKSGMYKDALADFRLASLYYDSISSEASFREMGSIEGKYELEKQIREQQLAETKAAADDQAKRGRSDRIQYFVIALILALLFVIIKLVGNLKLSEKVSHLVTLIAVLLFFEFLLVVMDPYVERLSGNIPAYKLLINLALALLIFPVHEWMLKMLSRSALIPHR